MYSSTVVMLAAIQVFLLGAQNPAAQEADKPDTDALRDFGKRVAEYRKLNKLIDGKLPQLKPTDSESKIKEHQTELAKGIREARKDAAQGDIFIPAIANEFKRLIAMTMRGARDTRIRQSLSSGEPVHLQLHVNEEYPNTVPVQSTPPTLLLNLPQLPPELDYRIVGHDLLLRDVKANLVVDLIPGAIP